MEVSGADGVATGQLSPLKALCPRFWRGHILLRGRGQFWCGEFEQGGRLGIRLVGGLRLSWGKPQFFPQQRNLRQICLFMLTHIAPACHACKILDASSVQVVICKVVCSEMG